MKNYLADLFKSAPHSFEDIRYSMAQDRLFNKDFFSILLEHHDYLKESIGILLDDESASIEKQEQLVRFFRLVEMHGKAEEETLYVYLKSSIDANARIEGYSGKDEHDVIFQMEDALLKMGYLTDWSEEINAKSRVVAGLVKSHLQEEEKRMFKIAKKSLTLEEVEQMRDEYLVKCLVYIDDFKTRSTGNWLNRGPSDLMDLPNFAP